MITSRIGRWTHLAGATTAATNSLSPRRRSGERGRERGISSASLLNIQTLLPNPLPARPSRGAGAKCRAQVVPTRSASGRLRQGFLFAAFSVFLLVIGRVSAVGTAPTNSVTAPPNLKGFPAGVEVKSAPEGRGPLPAKGRGLRGVFFNPQVKLSESPEFP